MGVPFNFPCVGLGIYVCARCGFELFSSSDAKISTTQSSRPFSFSKPINSESIMKLSSEALDNTFRVSRGSYFLCSHIMYHDHVV